MMSDEGQEHCSLLPTTIWISVHRHGEQECLHGALGFKRYLCKEHPKLWRSAPTKSSSTSEGVQEKVRSKWRHKKLHFLGLSKEKQPLIPQSCSSQGLWFLGHQGKQAFMEEQVAA